MEIGFHCLYSSVHSDTVTEQGLTDVIVPVTGASVGGSATRGAVLNIRECKQAASVDCSYKYQVIMEAVLMNEMSCHLFMLIVEWVFVCYPVKR